MQKSAEAFRTISEVSKELNVPKHVLRFWEIKFTYIRPMKRGGGRRYYRPEDIELLNGIRALLHADGFTIKGVQKIFKEQGAEYIKSYGRGEAPGGHKAISLAKAETAAQSQKTTIAKKGRPRKKTKLQENINTSSILKIIRELEACRDDLKKALTT